MSFFTVHLCVVYILSFSMISSSVILPPFFFCLSAALEAASPSGAGSGSITDLVYTWCKTGKKKIWNTDLGWDFPPFFRQSQSFHHNSQILCVLAEGQQLEVVYRRRHHRRHPCHLTGRSLYPACLAETANICKCKRMKFTVCIQCNVAHERRRNK